MVANKKVVVIMPAYNAGQTLRKTFNEIPFDVVDEVILTDDQSTDDTVKVAQELGINYIIEHDENKGYGGNCFFSIEGFHANSLSSSITGPARLGKIYMKTTRKK